MSEMKPCPFCGGKNVLSTEMQDGLAFIAYCQYAAENEAENRNIRPIEDDLRKHIAELEAFIERLIEAGRMMKQPETIEEFHRGRRDYDALVAEWKGCERW